MEGSDYPTASYSSDSFEERRRTYDETASRSYEVARSKGVEAADLLPDSITTDVRAPVLIGLDMSTSTEGWPSTFCSKSPYVDHETKCYLGDSYAIGYGAFGDAYNNEDYPVQCRPLGKGEEISQRISELIPERGGGPGIQESAELWALYVDRNVKTPKAIRPILIFNTDEMCYPTIYPEQAKKWAKVDLQQPLSTKTLFESLLSKWSVYVILKPRKKKDGSIDAESNREILRFWQGLVGADHVIVLDDCNRVVDVYFGILGQETGKVEYFYEELHDRQGKDVDGAEKIRTVTLALDTLHRRADSVAAHQSRPAGRGDHNGLPDESQHSVLRGRNPNSRVRRSRGLLPNE